MESHYISPENDPSEGAVLEICEIEVFGRYTCSLKTPTKLIKKISKQSNSQPNNVAYLSLFLNKAHLKFRYDY